MADYPPGYRFIPNDEELIDYLKMRMRNDPIPVTDIRDANVYASDPKNLIAEIFPEYGEIQKSGYFFSPRDRKYPKGSRPNRKAGNGFWKATGFDIKIKGGSAVIGHKKVLCFLTGEHPHGHKTKWIMHEYTLPGQPPRVKVNEKDMRLDDWVLCHIYERAPRRSDEDHEQVPVDDNIVAQQQDDDNVQVVESHDAVIAAHDTATEAEYTTDNTAVVENTDNVFDQLMPLPEIGNPDNWFDYQAYNNDWEGTSSSYDYESLLGEMMNEYSNYGSPFGNDFEAQMLKEANEATKRTRRK